VRRAIIQCTYLTGIEQWLVVDLSVSVSSLPPWRKDKQFFSVHWYNACLWLHAGKTLFLTPVSRHDSELMDYVGFINGHFSAVSNIATAYGIAKGTFCNQCKLRLSQ
jgi:hypothetical protein